MNVETVGMIFIFIEVFAAGFQPVFTKLAVETINPIFAASIASLIGCIIPLVILIRNRNLKLIIDRKNIKNILLIGLFGTTITYLLFFFGAQLTSGINTAILMQSEPIYAIFLGYLILKEKISPKQILSTFLIILGIIAVIYNGSFSFNLGDFLILITPLFYQISHVIAKRTMKKIGTYAVQAGRYLFAGLTLFLISSLFNMNQFSILTNPLNLTTILILGFIVAGIGTLAYYEGIRRINLSKAQAILAPYSVVSVILAWFILKEVPTVYQIVGLVIILIGIFSLVKMRSEKRS